MSVYKLNSDILQTAFSKNEDVLSQAYDIDKNPLLGNIDNPYDAAHANGSIFAGGYIEIQPDSWDGSTVCTGDIVDPTDPTAWGFPMSLSASAKASIKEDILSGQGYGVSYIRFPMGFGYRGYRNIDATTGLAKNIGQRWEGQNTELKAWFKDIADAGGGLSVEYWCPPVYWLTGGAYYNPNVRNELWAGGSYPRTTTLASIRISDPTQYNAQINAFTNAILNDLEYVHTNICPVRMYTLAGEPSEGGQTKYGHCHWDKDVYTDVFEILHPKVMNSKILAKYNNKENIVLMHLCADNRGFTIGTTFIRKHKDWIWGYSHDTSRLISGQDNGAGADLLKNLSYPVDSSPEWKNVFICEYEYFSDVKSDQYKFANNVVRIIFEMWYRKAKVVMPVIHICKPKGQSDSATNTKGYCLYAVDMSTGEYTTNPWSYNSWKMFNDNVPIGSIIWKGGDAGLLQAGYIILRKETQMIILMGNYSDSTKTMTLSFNDDVYLTGKEYSLSKLGEPYGVKSGKEIQFSIPAFTGLVWSNQ